MQTYKYLIIFSLAALLNAQDLNAAIAFDESISINSSNSTTVTWSHTTGSGADRILLVGITTKTGKTVTSVTYNGINLAKLSNISNTVNVELWYLLNPTSGANNVVVTLSASDDFLCGSQTYSGVDQISPFGTAVTNTGNSLTASVIVSSATDELVVDATGASWGTGPTTGSGQSVRYSHTVVTQYNTTGSSEPGAASVTMSWSVAAPAANWAIIGVPLKPAAPLHVQVLSLRIYNRQAKGVALLWKTTAEVNSHYFVVERSKDGSTFESIGKVEAAGNSSDILHYQFTDHKPLKGKSFYRIKQMDFDGSYSYTKTEVFMLRGFKEIQLSSAIVQKGESLEVQYDGYSDSGCKSPVYRTG